MSSLNRLNQVDWNGMGSPDLPRWMHDAMSDDKKVRDDAFHKIVVHLAPADCADCLYGCTEGDRLVVMKRETAFQLVPFLIEMLRDEQMNDDNKLTVLAIMESLLHWRHTEACLSEVAVTQVFRPYMKRLRNTLSPGIPIYKQLAERGNSSWIREEAQIVLENLEL
jgi:hypothetical protein